MKGPGLKAKKKLATPGRKFASGNISGRIDMTLDSKLAVGRVSKKPASLAARAFRGFKNVAKGLGRRATGVAGMMVATTGTALGSNKSLKLQEGAARRLFNKRKNK